MNGFLSEASAALLLRRRRAARRRRASSEEVVGGGGPAYTLPTPVVLHGFDSTTGWFAGTGGALSIAEDAAAKVQGTSAVRFTDTSGTTSSNATHHAIGNFDPAAFGVVALYADLGEDPDLQCTGSLGFRIGAGGANGSGGSYDFNATIGENLGGGSNNINHKGYWVARNISELSNLPAPGVIGIRMDTSVAPGGRAIVFDSLLANAGGRPTMLLTFDDGLDTQPTLGLSMMSYYGFKGTCFIPWADIGVKGGRMNLAGVQTLRDAGWSICLDGTEDDAVMTGLADPAACVTKLAAGRTWLTTNGCAAEGGDYLCYPNGEFRGAAGGANAVTVVQKTGVGATSGSAVLTMADTSSLAIGQRVVGYGIPNVSRIVSISANVSITIDNNATQTWAAGRIKATDDAGAFYTGKLQAALRAAGFKFGRNTLGGSIYSRYGVGGSGLNLPGNSSTNATAASLKAYVDTAILRGSTMCVYFHGFQGAFDPNTGLDDGTATTTLTVGTGPMNGFLAYLKSKVDANLIDVLTVPAWWARDCANPATPPAA